MVWEFLERWKGIVRLDATTSHERVEATARVRDAFEDVGASITDVHFFSGVQTALAFEAEASRLPRLEEALERAGLHLTAASREVVERAAHAPGEVNGTLAVTFAHGDPDLKHEVPAVPG